MRGRERERESETEVFKAKAKENIEHCFYNFGVETKRDETGKRVQLTSKTKEKAKKFLKGCSNSGYDNNDGNDDNNDNNVDDNDDNDGNESGSSDGRFVLTKLLTKSFFKIVLPCQNFCLLHSEGVVSLGGVDAQLRQRVVTLDIPRK